MTVSTSPIGIGKVGSLLIREELLNSKFWYWNSPAADFDSKPSLGSFAAKNRCGKPSQAPPTLSSELRGSCPPNHSLAVCFPRQPPSRVVFGPTVESSLRPERSNSRPPSLTAPHSLLRRSSRLRAFAARARDRFGN